MTTPILKCFLIAATWFAFQAAPASRPDAVHVQSFRNGKTRIAEQTFVANLNEENPNFSVPVMDEAGHNRYRLSFDPERVSEEDHHITGWKATLIDEHRPYLGNLLVTTAPPAAPGDKANDLAWWLNPNPYATVPLMAERVFRVEDFYCVVQVRDHHLIRGRYLLDSMKVEARFSGKAPQEDKPQS